MDCLRIVSAGFLLFAYGLVLTQAFNGAGDTWTPTWMNFACFWVWQIPLAWGLALAVHGILVWTRLSRWGRDWESRKIREFMDRY